MILNEYLEEVDESKIFKLMSDKEVEDVLKTPFGELNKKYRNLFPYPVHPGELNNEEEARKYYTQQGKSLEQIIRRRLNHEGNFYEYFEPYFVYKDETNEPCGYIVYESEDKESLIVDDVVLFSFDVSRKDFGKQIWIDFEKDLKRKVKEGYDISWMSRKSNPACIRYDRLIKDLNGKKTSKGRYCKYHIGSRI